MAWHAQPNPTGERKKGDPPIKYAKKKKKKLKNASQNALPRFHSMPPSTYKKIPKRTEKEKEEEEGPKKQR
jgi:hypothetical protein